MNAGWDDLPETPEWSDPRRTPPPEPPGPDLAHSEVSALGEN